MKTRTYGMLEVTAKKRSIVMSYMGSMSSRLQDVQESLTKLVGKTLATRFMKTAIVTGSVQYCLVVELPQANAPRLFEDMVEAL